MRVQGIFALSDARSPRRVVADFRCAVDARSVARRAHLFESVLAGGRYGGRAAACGRGRRDGERAVVLTGNRLAPERRGVLLDGLLDHRIIQLLGVLILSERARKGEQHDGERDEDAEHHAERIEEMGI
jgi:hypothetical protein